MRDETAQITQPETRRAVGGGRLGLPLRLGGGPEEQSQHGFPGRDEGESRTKGML